jgi:hypothetical protein
MALLSKSRMALLVYQEAGSVVAQAAILANGGVQYQE